MVWTEAPAPGESRRQLLLPGTCGYRASRRLYPVSGMIAPARCDWTPLWNERHSRSDDLSEEQVQACLGKRGPGQVKGGSQTVFVVDDQCIKICRFRDRGPMPACDRLVQFAV